MIWTRNVQMETRVRVPTWGFAGSPTVFENLLMLTVGEEHGARQRDWQECFHGSSDEASNGTAQKSRS